MSLSFPSSANVAISRQAKGSGQPFFEPTFSQKPLEPISKSLPLESTSARWMKKLLSLAHYLPTLDFGLASLNVTSIIKAISRLIHILNRRMAHYVLQTYIPKPIPLVQRIAYKLNQLIFLNPKLDFLPWHYGTVHFADDWKLRRLQSLARQKTGVILAGAHPDMGDGHLLAEIHRQAGQFPAFIPINSEALSKLGHFTPPELLFLLKPILSALGLAPIKRGERSDMLKNHGQDILNQGQWLSLFPEAHIHLGPRVFPMRKGAVEMALKAAIASQFEKPILLQPFAHVWQYHSQKEMQYNMTKIINNLSGKLFPQDLFPMTYTDNWTDLNTHVFKLGNKLLEHTRQVHDIARPDNWEHMDFWMKANYLQKQSLYKLEARYGLPHDETRIMSVRVIKIRMKIWHHLASLPQHTLKIQRPILNHDLRCTSELHFLHAFNKMDLHDYGNGEQLDPEMLGIYVRRFCALTDWKWYWKNRFGFGKQTATVQLLDPIDMRSYARHYDSLATQAEKDRYAAELTETCLQKPIQEAANRLRRLASCPIHI
jgi:Acyltransferase